MTVVERPLLPLDAGEQYRFAFSMEACVGCHSCEVACAEQNGNPAGVNWRRVGELEAGSFPDTKRFNLSMACNHCLDPACLTGCPTNAYIKLDNGIVKHQAEECIGCQYCIWNCPYEVPAFNPERGIVTKCDMCLPRLEAGRMPACVDACPTGAITVERVNVAAWRDDHASANGPGLPPADITLSTTRVILPATTPAMTLVASDQRVRPEHPHWPLIALTLLTQLALGAVAATVAAELIVGGRRADALTGGAVAAAVCGALAMAVSLLHLGRPIQAWRALRNLRSSWLSREVALFGLFAIGAISYAAAWFAGLPTLALGVVTVGLGAAGVYASGRLYLVPARPVWNSPRTLVAFFATAMATGPLVALLAVDRDALGGGAALLLSVGAGGTIAQLLVYRALIERVAGRGEREYRGTARLLFEHFRTLFFVRLALAASCCGLLAIAAFASTSSALLGAALCAAAVGELLGRYLFYVTVTPMSTAGTFHR
ncbi:MAG TPA: DmsC/YnfH family molybdoenzyme membrane anchor subunit [Acidimicrobiales bacterium]|nr:DmsC/YnfH family molybdoenzyme membrane anchor subunit [Acidimicrobiales bacterium]